MSKLLGLIALTGLMTVGLASTSQAQLSFTIVQPTAATGLPADADSFVSGVTTNGVGDTTTFITVLSTATGPQTFTGDSSISFGTTAQNGATGTASYSAVPANMTFDLTVPDITILPNATKSFQVMGVINGTSTFDAVTGAGASNAFFSPTTILVDGVAQTLIATTSPAGRQSLEIAALNFGPNTNVDVFFDQVECFDRAWRYQPSLGWRLRALQRI